MERDRSSVARSGGWGTTWVSAGVQRAFDSFDANRSGFLDYRELRTALRQLGFASDTKTAVDVLRRYDSDANGRLDVGEFNTLVHELLRHEPVSASVRRAFDAFDRNKNGYLEARELRAALRQMGFEADASATLAVLRQFDDDQNQRLDVYEFGLLVQELERIAAWMEGADPLMDGGHPGAALAPAVSDSVRRAFEAFDRNGNGYLEAREVRIALREMGFEADAAATSALLGQFDDDLDRRLDVHEFDAMVHELAKIQDLRSGPM